MINHYCMKYFFEYECDDHHINGHDCSKCAFRLRQVVALDDVQKLLAECKTTEEALCRLSELNAVSTEHMTCLGAEKLAGSEEV